ncbi:MAG: polymer-forming cytoskeletal protein [Deltaproteobacteria bacterium]|nr:polymer-forming cytoskeletal protein [Deltaproteobacteria bacterium]
MFKGQVEKSVRADQVNGLLDKGCSFEGKLTFDGTVQINGNFQGEVYSDGTLIIGNDAHVEGGIFVDTLIIYGSVQGAIDSKSRVEMHVPATVLSDIKTKTLSIEEGVIFQGKCQMDRPETSKTSAKTPATKEKSAGAEGSETDDNVFVM